MEVIIKIDGMNCEHCSKRIEKTLNDLIGVNSIAVSLLDNCAKIEYDENKIKLEEIYQAIEESGYKPVK